VGQGRAGGLRAQPGARGGERGGGGARTRGRGDGSCSRCKRRRQHGRGRWSRLSLGRWRWGARCRRRLSRCEKSDSDVGRRDRGDLSKRDYEKMEALGLLRKGYDTMSTLDWDLLSWAHSWARVSFQMTCLCSESKDIQSVSHRGHLGFKETLFQLVTIQNLRSVLPNCVMIKQIDAIRSPRCSISSVDRTLVS